MTGGPEVASLLADAEQVVNQVADEVLAEVRQDDAKRERSQGRKWWRRRR